MNNYQIYDEIGKGRHSIVYKGRKKKSIEYFAIASIEKSQRQRVLTSVQFLRSLHHKNVIRFHNWYETNNHLWVITEYCIGGDLRAVLDLDQCLSEASVRVLGSDLVDGLMHIHSRGIIYGDLKPSNILMDATASLRYYDFGLSCSFESAGSAAKVGTPTYMAPELYREGGVPSMASDLWSLGCVLYEMATGKPPFSSSTIQGLIQKVVNEPHRRAEQCGAPFNELIEGLLQKDPLERFTWEDVVASELWQNRVSSLPSSFPPQPAFAKFRQEQLDLKRPMSKEVERRNKEILRASVNAERNLARELAQNAGGAYTQQQNGTPQPGGVLNIDREVDFSEHTDTNNPTESEPQSAAPGLSAVPTSTFSLEPKPASQQTSIVPSASATNTIPAIEDLLSHPSDAHIRPLVTNARIEKLIEQKYEPATLGFQAMPLSVVKQLSSKDLESFLTTVYKALSVGTGDVSDRLNVLYYFEQLCGDSAIANVVINSSVMTLCVKLAATNKGPQAASFRAAVASIMGLLVRHSTFIHGDLAKSGVVAVLVESLIEEQNIKASRKLLACLGELLFYIGTQSSEERSLWPMDPLAIRRVYLNSMHNEDDVLKHYAVKAIENLASISDRTVVRQLFASPDVIESLLWIYSLPLAPPARSEHLKSSAVCAALKVCVTDDQLITCVFLSSQLHASTHGELLANGNAKIVQILISTINTVLWRVLGINDTPELRARHGPHSTPSTVSPDAGNEIVAALFGNGKCAAFVGGLGSVLEHSTAAVRAKGLMCVALLSSLGDGFVLGEGCENSRIFSSVDKVIKDKDPYVQKCVPALVHALGMFVDATGELLANNVQCCSLAIATATLFVLTSSNLRCQLAVTDKFLVNLAQAVRLCYQPATAAMYSPYEAIVHHMVEAIASDGVLRANHYLTLASTVVQPYAEILTHAEGSKRFSAIQMILQLLTPIVQDGTLYNPAASMCPVVPIVNQFMTSLSPLVPQLLQDGDPIPLYTLKLLSVCCERSPTVTLSLMQPTAVGTPRTIELLLAFLEPTHNTNCVHVVKVLLRMLQCGTDEQLNFAVQQSLIPKLLATMQHAQDDGTLDTFAEPCFELAFYLLCAAVNDPSSAVAQEASHFIVQRHLETVFFPACASRLGAASECAASSVFLLTQLFAEARYALLQTNVLSLLRDIFSDVDESTVHTVLPLLRALLLCVSVSQASTELRNLQQNEPLLVMIQTLASNTGLNSELATVAADLLQALYRLT